MIRRAVLLVLLLAVLVTVACDPSPVEEAEGHAIEVLADVEVLATATAVALGAEEKGVAISATATAVADEEWVRAESQEERLARVEAIIGVTKWVCILLIVVWGVAASASGAWAAVGSAQAWVTAVELRARLVRLDSKTRTWPVMLDLQSGRMVNLETGERADLGVPQQVDHRRVVISGQVRNMGLLAQAAYWIAKVTKSASPADNLAAIAMKVPLADGPIGEERREGL